jgi:hypothetical protein
MSVSSVSSSSAPSFPSFSACTPNLSANKLNLVWMGDVGVPGGVGCGLRPPRADCFPDISLSHHALTIVYKW